MKWKKIVSVLLCAVMAVSISGCNGKRGASSDEVATLIWYVPGEKQADTAEVMEAVNAIIEPEIGAKLDLKFIDQGSYTEKMNMIQASGEVFDLCFTGFVNPFNLACEKGAFMALDELIEAAPELTKELPSWLLDAGKYKGELYGIPNYQVVSGWQIPWVRTELIEECGLDLSEIKSADDLEIIFEKIHAKRPDLYTWRSSNGAALWNGTRTSVTSGVFIDVKDETMTPTLEIEREGFDHFARVIRSWYEKGYIRSDAASAGDDNLDYVNGKYAVFQSIYKPSAEVELETTLGYDVTPIMIGESVVTRDSCTAAMTAISRTSEHPEKAIKLLEQVNTNKELYNLICYGIEGKHYEWVDDTHISLKKDGGYYVNAAWKFGNNFNAYLLEGMAENVWEETIAMNDAAIKSPLLAFTFDTTSVISEMSQFSAVNSEYSAMHNGSRPVDDYIGDYIKRMKDAGADTLLAEAQKQLGEYKKTLNGKD